MCSTHARQLLQNINKVFRISRRKFDTFYTEIELKTTKNSGGKLRIDRDIVFVYIVLDLY